MRKTILIMSSLLLMASCDKASDKKTMSGEPFKGTNYSIKFPSNWERKDGFMGCDLMALSPAEGANDNFRENANITLENLPSRISLEKYAELSRENMKKLLSDFEIIEETEANLNGHTFKRFVSTYRMGEIDIKAVLYLTTKDKAGYNITFSASPETYDSYIDEFESIAKTFRFE